MRVKALRGVCIGVDRHLKAGDIEDLEPALVTYLSGIGAVEAMKDEPELKPEPEAKPEVKAPEKSGKKEK
jgi:hypothetical protein